MSLKYTIAAAILLSLPAQAQSTDSIRHVVGRDVESLPDGSDGRVFEYRASDGTFVPAYIRKPKGPGPFPVVVVLHGGAPEPNVTYLLGRTTNPPAANFVAAGWAVFVADYHPNPTVPSSDRADAMAAIDEVRHLPFIDGKRMALFGGSHGANVISRIATQVDVRCAVMCAPAILDLYEISKVIDQGVEVASILKKMVGDAPKKYGAPLAEVVKDPPKYKYESSILDASKIRCPLMLINGRNVTSAPIAVTQAYLEKLKASGKQVETYFPDDGRHGFYFGFMDNRNSGKPADITTETKEAARRATAFIQKHFQ